MTDQNLSARRILVLDGLRGLAVILVIVCHVNWSLGGPFSAGIIDGPLTMVLAWGWIGVDLFFVLSGFLITGILFDAKSRDGYFRNFYARRVLRIMPLYYGFLIFTLALNQLHLMDYPRVTRENLPWLATYTYNFRVGLGGSAVGGMHHFWSLAVEEHFYLLWPLMVLALSRRALMRACLALAAISFVMRVVLVLSGGSPLAAFFLTPFRLDGLLAGSWIALAWRDEADWDRLRPWAGPLMWGVGGLLLAIALWQGHFIPDADPRRMPGAVRDGSLVVTVGLAGLAVLFSALIVQAVNADEGSGLRRVLEYGPLRSIGKYSYAIYVFHVLILFVTVEVLEPESSLPLWVAKGVVVVWVLAASFVVAWISYHFYEQHFLRLKRHFEYRESAADDGGVSPSNQSLINA